MTKIHLPFLEPARACKGQGFLTHSVFLVLTWDNLSNVERH